jgi:hypothetical protein
VLTKSWNIVSTVALGTGVIFPTPTTGGYVLVIINKGANILFAYPNSGAAIDSQAANVAYQIAINNIVTFRAASPTQWYSSAGIAPGSGLSSLLTEVNSGTTFSTSATTYTSIIDMTYTIPIANPITKCLVLFNGSGGVSSSGVATYAVFYTPPIPITAATSGVNPTIFTATNTLVVNDIVTISGVTPAAYNVTGVVTAATATTFSIAQLITGPYVSGGAYSYLVGNSNRAIQPPGSGARAVVATQAVITPVSVGGIIDIRVFRSSGSGTISVDTRSMTVMGVA